MKHLIFVTVGHIAAYLYLVYWVFVEPGNKLYAFFCFAVLMVDTADYFILRRIRIEKNRDH